MKIALSAPGSQGRSDSGRACYGRVATCIGAAAGQELSHGYHAKMTVVTPTRERVVGQQVFGVFLMRKDQQGTQARKRRRSHDKGTAGGGYEKQEDRGEPDQDHKVERKCNAAIRE